MVSSTYLNDESAARKTFSQKEVEIWNVQAKGIYPDRAFSGDSHHCTTYGDIASFSAEG
jgi:hypothetical protein